MLKKFRTKGFKNFEHDIVFDFSNTCNYAFNQNAIHDGLITKGLIYGINGSGKSNLGCAIFDITIHLTDNQKALDKYEIYENFDSAIDYVEFQYDYICNDMLVTYEYRKTTVEDLLFEKLTINNDVILQYDFVNHKGFVNLEGAENLLVETDASSISRVRYIKNNAILANTPVNNAFKSFIDEVNRMLLFYSLQGNRYQGFTTGRRSVGESIIENGKINDFEDFLRKVGIDMHLFEKEIDGEKMLYCRYANGEANFFRVASTGMKSLALFYFWYIQMEKASFVFIDEFDAFYHYELSEAVVRKLLELENVQVILTTHNTDLLSNNLLRPDCYFELSHGRLKSLANLTPKELRQAHNLQKMYKAGAFDE